MTKLKITTYKYMYIGPTHHYIYNIFFHGRPSTHSQMWLKHTACLIINVPPSQTIQCTSLESSRASIKHTTCPTVSPTLPLMSLDQTIYSPLSCLIGILGLNTACPKGFYIQSNCSMHNLEQSMELPKAHHISYYVNQDAWGVMLLQSSRVDSAVSTRAMHVLDWCVVMLILTKD